ncbi:peroxisomal 2 4-dienoyl-CoA reductase sps19 [Cryptotrichosporon argae]
MTFQPDIFAGKVLFCTGGRSGIGYAVTAELMRHGCNAVIVGRDAAGLADSTRALEKATGRKCLAAAADVREPAQIEAAVEAALEAYGKIDFVVCGAAGNFLAPISTLSPNAFRTVVAIDLLGTFNTIKATLPAVRASAGSYVHISATLHYRGTALQAHVSAAKAGVDALSHVLAVEEGPRGVRSNVIAPGPIANTVGMSKLQTSAQTASMVPLGRFGDPADIAAAAVFLFSPAAQWVTGTVLVVDGGDQHVRPVGVKYPEGVLAADTAVAKL